MSVFKIRLMKRDGSVVFVPRENSNPPLLMRNIALLLNVSRLADAVSNESELHSTLDEIVRAVVMRTF